MRFRRPWVSIPARNTVGATRGRWWIAITVIVVPVLAVAVVLVLVDAGVLGRPWAYACLPIALFAAAAARLVTVFKAAAEDKQT